MENILSHDYLWQSDEFTAFVRSTTDLDLIPGLREKIKFAISKHQKSS